jgi:hypothetical protein
MLARPALTGRIVGGDAQACRSKSRGTAMRPLYSRVTNSASDIESLYG